MKLTRNKRAHSEVNAGALTDIMFFLLLFFLIVSTMANPNVIKVFLPQASPSSDIAKNNLVVTVSKDLAYYVGNSKEPIPLEELRNKIEESVKDSENKSIQVNVDKDVPAQYLVNVLDIGMQLKIRVVIGTERVASN